MTDPTKRHLLACVAPSPRPDIEEGLAGLGWTTTNEPAGADALIWVGGRPAKDIADFLAPSMRWIQLPSAGIESFINAGVIDTTRVWASATDAYSAQVAEHSLALLLAVRHRFPFAARNPVWHRLDYQPLADQAVLIVGAGGIGRRLAQLLDLLGSEVIAVNRSGEPVPHARRTWPTAVLSDHWADAPNIALAAPLTPETRHIVNAESLSRMQPGTCLVNVGRGELVDADALVEALHSGIIGGAGLDVTEPEPLPAEHPLWNDDRVLITSHSANPTAVLERSYVRRVVDNAQRFANDQPLLGVISLERSY